VVITPGVLDTFGKEIFDTCLLRHASGDWGDAAEDSAKMNDEALAAEVGQIMSVYNIRGDVLWIITEHDRSVTTGILPDEY
jgi:hypothetical protein